MTLQVRQLFENTTHTKALHFIFSNSSSLSQTKQSHAYLLRSGIFNDTAVSSRLITLYANHHCFTEAKHVLRSLEEPTITSFSPLIYAFTNSNMFPQSLAVFSQMVSLGLPPDKYVMPNAIKACTALSALRLGQQFHALSFLSGFALDSFVQASIFHLYVNCGRIDDAHKLFDRMPRRDVVTCSALLSGYARNGFVKEAVSFVKEMEKLGVEPNLVSWNGMITGFRDSGNLSEAVMVLKKMHFEGFKPDGITVSSVLPAVGQTENLNVGVQIHGYAIKQGLGTDKCLVSALIDMYGNCQCATEISRVFDEIELRDTGVCNAYITGLSRNGLISKALEMFTLFKEQEVELNVVSWTSIISGCTQNGKDIEALEFFREMQVAGVKPNAVTIPSMLPACGNIAALIHGKAAHGFCIRKGIWKYVQVGSALTDMYAKCGRIHSSRICFDRMPKKNLVCWNAIIGGYAMHGKAQEALSLFSCLEKSGLKPDFISFTCILSACSQGGLIDEGRHYFNKMSKEHEIEPRLEHYACMVALLGRTGKLDEAYNFIKEMRIEPDACIWGALLSSCRVHNNVSLGEVSAKKLFELEEANPGNYVLLSNIYAAKGMWTEVDTVRDMMRKLGMRKNPGCSWIQVKNKMYMLLAGDNSLPEMTQIHEKLSELYFEMKKSGYFPNIGYVLQDVEEQDKEHILCAHSEKLAVVLGILKTPPRSPLQVIKNLRICGDCHTVIKYISSSEGREITVRDTNRFHHFKDGVCSCGDYW